MASKCSEETLEQHLRILNLAANTCWSHLVKEPTCNLEKEINNCMKRIPSCQEINKIDEKYPVSTHMHMLNSRLSPYAGCVLPTCPTVKRRKEVLLWQNWEQRKWGRGTENFPALSTVCHNCNSTKTCHQCLYYHKSAIPHSQVIYMFLVCDLKGHFNLACYKK